MSGIRLSGLKDKFIAEFDTLYAPLKIDTVRQLPRNLLIKARYHKRAAWLYVVPLTKGLPSYVEQASNIEEITAYEADIKINLKEEAHRDFDVVVLAETLSDKSKAYCRAEGVGYFDALGGVYLDTPGFLIDKAGAPPAEIAGEHDFPRTAKAERLLRTLVCDPKTQWMLPELAQASRLSKSYVATILQPLTTPQWVLGARYGKKGYTVSSKTNILSLWSKKYRRYAHEPFCFRPPYSLDKPAEFENELQSELKKMGAGYAFSGFSAAARYTMTGRYMEVFAYAQITRDMARALASKLHLQSVRQGPVRIWRPLDDRYFEHAQDQRGLRVVHPAQTYLDLMHGAFRGEEAATQFFNNFLDLDGPGGN